MHTFFCIIFTYDEAPPWRSASGTASLGDGVLQEVDFFLLQSREAKLELLFVLALLTFCKPGLKRLFCEKLKFDISGSEDIWVGKFKDFHLEFPPPDIPRS